MNSSRILEQYPIISTLENTAKEIILERAIPHTILSGAYLKQSECSGLLLILQGKLKIEKIDEEGRQTSLYEVSAGELCYDNIACYLGCTPFHIVGYAEIDTHVVMIPNDVVRQYVINNPTFLTFAYQELHKKLHYMIHMKEWIIHERLEHKIIACLKDKGQSIVYITHQQLALEISSSREAVSRKLKDMEHAGKIKLARGKITLLGI